MELIKDFLSIANLSCCIIIVVWIAKNYLKPYLSEHAKSHVEKRDKEELTKKEEGVKAIYSKDLELIKHQLNQVLNLKTQHKNEERQSITKILENSNKWLFNLKHIKLTIYYPHNLDDLILKIDAIEDEIYLNIHIERIRIFLFITNQDVNESMRLLIDAIEIYKIEAKAKMNKVVELLKEQFYSSYEEYVEGYIETHYQIDNMAIIRKLSEDFDNFNQEYFNNCWQLTEDFAKKSKQYLISTDFNR